MRSNELTALRPVVALASPDSDGIGAGERRRRWRAWVLDENRSCSAQASKWRGWGVSMWCGECNGLEPVTKRSPELCRRRCVRTLIGDGAGRHGRERAQARWAPRNPRSTTVSLGERDSGCGHGGEVHRGDQIPGMTTS